MNTHIGIEGWLTWELINSDGTIEESQTQHNMVLNSGLDFIATYGFFPNLYLSGFANVAVLGTGTTPPAISQVALANEIARSATVGGGTETFVRQGDNKFIFTHVREFAANVVANQNLTEWGFAPGNTGNISVRELFRDGSNNPVVITPDGTQTLRLVYALTLTMDPAVYYPNVKSGSFNVSGVGTITGTYYMTNSGNDLSGWGPDDLTFLDFYSAGTVYSSFVSLRARTDYMDSGAQNYTFPAADSTVFNAYVPGSYAQTAVYTFNTSTANANPIKSLTIGFGGIAYAFVFTNGQSITKDNTHKLIVTGPTLTWGRSS